MVHQRGFSYPALTSRHANYDNATKLAIFFFSCKLFVQLFVFFIVF